MSPTEPHDGYCTPWTGCCNIVEASSVNPAVIAAVGRAVAAASAALGVSVSRVAYFSQTVFHGSFKTVNGRPGMWFDSAVRGVSNVETGEIWLNAALGPDEAAKVVYHEVAHLAGADESEATRYADKATVAVEEGLPLPPFRESFWQHPVNYAVDLPATAIPIPKEGYYGVSLKHFAWDTWDGGGTVQVIRTRDEVDVVVEEWTSDTGSDGGGLAAPIPCRAGDTISVFIDHGDSSPHNLVSAEMSIYLIDREALQGWESVFVATNHWAITWGGSSWWTSDHAESANPGLFERSFDGTVLNSYAGWDPGEGAADPINSSLVFAESFLWGVGQSDDPSVHKIDPADGSVDGSISPNVSTTPALGWLGVGYDGTNLFAAESSNEIIEEYTTAGAFVQTHNYPSGHTLAGITWDGVHWWATTLEGAVLKLDTSFVVLSEIAGPPSGAEYDLAGREGPYGDCHYRGGFIYVMTPAGLWRKQI